MTITPTAPPAAPTPTIPMTVCWRYLDADTARTEWERITEWVDWFAHHYRISTTEVPICWHLHWPLVEELSGLRSAWYAAFIIPTRAPVDADVWHRNLHMARARLRGWTSDTGCASTHNRSTKRPEIDTDSRSAAIGHDVDRR